MEYKIIVSATAEHLEYMIGHHIAKGWEPIGGVSIARSMGGDSYAQAIIKEEKEPNK